MSGDSRRGITTGTPVPRAGQQTMGAGPVTTYRMSPEELEKYLADKYGSTKKPDGKKPIELRHGRKVDDEVTKITLTKEEYLAERIAGKSRAQIANEQGLKHLAYLYPQLQKWEIKDKDAEEAAMADLRNGQAQIAAAEDKASEQTETPVVPETTTHEVPDSAETSSQTPGASADNPCETPKPLPRRVVVEVPIDESFMRAAFELVVRDVHQTAIDHGWHQGIPSLPVQLALIHSEVSEALEADRKYFGGEAVAEELADIIIRVMDTAASQKLDLVGALFRKMETNRGREFRHGGRKY